MSHDVIVLGLGVLGSSTAYRLAARGQRVLALERYHPVHDLGASHGETRCVFRSYFMGPRYVPLVEQSLALWEQTGEDAGEPLVRRAGGLLLSSGGGRLVSRVRSVATECGIEHEVLDADAVHDRFPALRPGEDTVAVHEPGAGFLNVEPAVRAQLELARRAGADLRFGERVLEWEETASGVSVRTSDGTYSAGKLVLCVGSWIDRFVDPGLLPVQIVRKVQGWFDPADAADEHTPERMPFYCWDTGDATALGFPVVAPGRGSKIALHTGGQPCDPDTVDRTVHESDVDELRAFAAGRLPHLAAGTCLRSEVGLYDLSPDREFIVGALPGHERVLVAAGTSGHAFKFAPLIGDALAGLATDGTTPYDVAGFDPARFGTLAVR